VTTYPASNPNRLRRRRPARAAAAALVLAASAACAVGDDDALNLSSAPVESEAAAPRASRSYMEFALGHADQRVPPTSQTLSRASLDLYFSGRLAQGWKGVFSDRFDGLNPAEPGSDSALNSLREAYVSWSDEAASLVADVGRVNMRTGPGYGYNPTDFFRDGSLRAYTTANPIALRENRMGSVMVRGQRLWQGGSISLALAPKLADAPSGDTFSLDLGATNASNRGVLALGLQPSDRVNLQFQLYKNAGYSPQPGISATALLSDAIVAYGEWSAGKEPSLADRAWGVTGRTVSAQRFVGGLTYTTASKLSLTAEVQANGFALSQDQWDATAAIDPALLVSYLQEAQYRQDLPTRRALMLYVTQQDLGRKNLDLTAFVEFNPGDSSHVVWLELRQRWSSIDLAVQLQGNVGRTNSVYGTLPERRSIQALLAYHF
jgi:hypothetical protein